jgi:hypothetical protein
MVFKRPYPDRPKCWANHVQKALINAEAIPVLGRDACWLIAYVAAREDMLFYKHVPKWWTPQLMDDAGFTNKKHFLKTRQTAIDAGWLIVNGGGKGVEGEYFTDIPVQFVGANSHQQTHQQDISRCESAPANVPLSEPTNAPLPNPYSPIPQIQEGAAFPDVAPKKSKRAAKTNFDPVKVALPESLQTAEFRAAWERWCKHRREKRKSLTETSVSEQIAELAEWGNDRAIAAIRLSIKKGWQGIFEDSSTQSNGKPSGNGSGTTIWQAIVKACVGIRLEDPAYPAQLDKQFGAATGARIRELKVRDIKTAADEKSKGKDFLLRGLEKRFNEMGGAE